MVIGFFFGYLRSGRGSLDFYTIFFPKSFLYQKIMVIFTYNLKTNTL